VTAFEGQKGHEREQPSMVCGALVAAEEGICCVLCVLDMV